MAVEIDRSRVDPQARAKMRDLGGERREQFVVGVEDHGDALELIVVRWNRPFRLLQALANRSDRLLDSFRQRTKYASWSPAQVVRPAGRPCTPPLTANTSLSRSFCAGR